MARGGDEADIRRLSGPDRARRPGRRRIAWREVRARPPGARAKLFRVIPPPRLPAPVALPGRASGQLHFFEALGRQVELFEISPQVLKCIVNRIGLVKDFEVFRADDSPL